MAIETTKPAAEAALADLQTALGNLRADQPGTVTYTLGDYRIVESANGELISLVRR